MFSCKCCEQFLTTSILKNICEQLYLAEANYRVFSSSISTYRVFTREFYPGMKSSLSMVKCLLLPIFFSRDKKKKLKKCVNTSSRGLSKNFPLKNCPSTPKNKLSPRKFPPMKIAPYKNTYLWNFPRSSHCHPLSSSVNKNKKIN